MRKAKFKANALWGLVAVIMLAAAIVAAPTVSANAAFGDSIRAVAIAERAHTYYYLDSPAAIYADEQGFAVSSYEGYIEFFDGNGKKKSTLETEATANYVYKSGNACFTLEAGKLVRYYGESEPEIYGEEKNYTVAAAYEKVFYAATGDEIDVYEIDGEDKLAFSKTLYAPDEVTALTPYSFENISDKQAYDGFVAVKSNRTGSLNDIYRIDGESEELSLIYPYIDAAGKMVFSPVDESICVLERNCVERFSIRGKGLESVGETALGGVCDISCNGKGYYVLTEEGAVSAYGLALENKRTIISSADDADGFFDRPIAATSKKGTVYVADFNNDRVAAVTDTGTTYISYDFRRPVSIAADVFGTVYVAHRNDYVERFDESGRHSGSLKSNFGFVRALVATSDGKLYAQGDDGIYVCDFGDGKFGFGNEPIYKGTVRSISTPPDGKALYFTDGESVYSLGDDGAEKLFTAAELAVSFAVDASKNVFMLTDGKIYKYEAPNYAAAIEPAPYAGNEDVSEGAAFITISAVENTLIKYGDVIVVDTARHSVLKIDGESIGVTDPLDGFETPKPEDDVTLDKSDITDEERIIRTTKYVTELYSSPKEGAPKYTIPAGRKVIVVESEVEENDSFALILVDDYQKKKLVAGYAYGFMLSEPLDYVEPNEETVTVYYPRTSVYKWPSQYAKPLSGYTEVKQGTKYELMSFVEGGYDDDSGLKWFKINVENLGVGYVLATKVTVTDYAPDYARPQFNAVIKSTAANENAEIYKKNADGTYEKVGGSVLNKGERVEVVGAFDPSMKYTKVKHFGEQFGTRECYVLTEHIEYKGVDVLQIVIAVLLMTILCVTGALLIIRGVVKRRKLTKI